MAAPENPNLWMLKAICLASGAALHIAPIPTMREIQGAKSTLNFHIAPYASTLLNHLVNGWYAAVRGDGPLMLHRAAGIIAQTYYLWTYISYSAPSKAADNKRWVSTVAIILAAIFADLHVFAPLLGLGDKYFSQIALFGAITGIGLAASPLATVREVLRTRDASSLPAHLCLMVFLQCSAWTVYGWVKGDWSTTANNAVGVVLGAAQLGLIAAFGNKRTAAAAGAAASKRDASNGAGEAGATAFESSPTAAAGSSDTAHSSAPGEAGSLLGDEESGRSSSGAGAGAGGSAGAHGHASAVPSSISLGSPVAAAMPDAALAGLTARGSSAVYEKRHVHTR